MAWILTKLLVSAGLIVLITELAKRSERLGALVTALPWVALLALVWMQLEQQPPDKIAGYAQYTFWYVLPTLPLFLIFPTLLLRVGFWPSLIVSVLVTAVLVVALSRLLKPFGVNLL